MGKRIDRSKDLSPFLSNEKIKIKSQLPFIMTMEAWEKACLVIIQSKTFKKIYNVKGKKPITLDDIVSIGAVVKAVWVTPPSKVMSPDGKKVLNKVEGVYNKKESHVLPPKLLFNTFWRELSTVRLDVSPPVNEREYNKFNWEMNFPPRKEQQELEQKVSQDIKSGKIVRGIVKANPGWGKTYISINIACQHGTQTLIIVPNELLEKQWIKAVTEFTNLTKKDIGTIQGSDINKLVRYGEFNKPILIAKIQSLTSQLQRCDIKELITLYSKVGCVFYDETHTSSSADGYAKTGSIFVTNNIIGLSATPFKKHKNKLQMDMAVGPMYYESDHQNLIPACNMNMFNMEASHQDMNKLVRAFQSDFNVFKSKLEDYMFSRDDYFHYLCKWTQFRLEQGHNVVILFSTNKMLDKLQNMLKKDFDTESVILIKDTNNDETKDLIAKSRVVLTNYKIFGAGSDFPHLSCCFFASLYLSDIGINQVLGRVTRVYKNKIQDVQAHFFVPKFVAPLFGGSRGQEIHNTIRTKVKMIYKTAQFVWSKEYQQYFSEKNQTTSQPNQNSNQQNYGTTVNGFIHEDNRLRQHMNQNNPFGQQPQNNGYINPFQ